jgi:predicted lipoprotein with Yx(FWY)xxD motif
MTKTLISLAIAAASLATAPAFADAENSQRAQFTHEGVTYTYTKTQLGQSTIYKGTATPGEPFFLVERKGQVTGKANGINVSFRTPKVEVVAGLKSLPLAAR